MKIFGVSLFTIAIIAIAYFAGSKGLLGKAKSAVGA